MRLRLDRKNKMRRVSNFCPSLHLTAVKVACCPWIFFILCSISYSFFAFSFWRGFSFIFHLNPPQKTSPQTKTGQGWQDRRAAVRKRWPSKKPTLTFDFNTVFISVFNPFFDFSSVAPDERKRTSCWRVVTVGTNFVTSCFFSSKWCAFGASFSFFFFLSKPNALPAVILFLSEHRQPLKLF